MRCITSDVSMRSKALLILLFLVVSCENRINPGLPSPPANVDLMDSFYYEINLNDRSNNTFKVRMYVNNLSETNSVFQFAATAPGIYTIADFGRYVSDFRALDMNYNELTVSHPSTNQWKISNPDRARVIEFEMSDTFHHPQSAHNIFANAMGSWIDSDFVLLNPVAVLGYPTGLAERDFYLKIDLPPGWNTGTSLPMTESGYYFASDYSQLADGPLLLGNLTTASALVDGTQFNVFAHSVTGKVDAEQVVSYSLQGWQDASKFLKVLPVKNYNYLYVWNEDISEDALEHSSSSVHMEPENGNSGLKARSLHEFFHIITPKTIHSEVIGNFNFGVPTPSEHLWWYEGVTVWAANTMRYRNGTINLNEWLQGIVSSGGQMSLLNVGLNCYNDGATISDAYHRGSMIAALLDIRLLELSGGTKGLRELILDLFEKYHDKPFPEDSFFEVLTEMTYPEIGDFLNRYVKGTENLPIQEYFNKLGIFYGLQRRQDNPTPEQQKLFDRWSINF